MNALFQELFHVGVYKRSQGRISRQVTFAAMAIILALGMYQFSETLRGAAPMWRYGLPGPLLMLGWWIVYRLVNLPAFADFLIAVEAEMNKVSWPTRQELFRGSAVVLIVIISLAIVLGMFDLIWRVVFTFLRVLPQAQ